ncbi:hypothetical protein LSTR_LSTR013307 [Laodelphax striatellus]|uniref:CRAL-TRIO domain-containing protein n=1 Tax=Laodelphax striatellus TaxID=195883 RepID=A0A482WE80_LAOST|nr:hypothetical protein LSTR_LSTR013307 [Laodelphax striatellus]
MVTEDKIHVEDIEWEEPSAETVQKWYSELKMTPESVIEDVNLLREWLRHQPHLPNVTDDKMLEIFLFQCKNSVETAKAKLEQYYVAKASMPEYFTDMDPLDAEFQQALETVCYVTLPKLTAEGYRICVCKMFNSDVTKFKPIHLFKGALMFADMSSRHGHNNGIVIIFDLQDRTMAHVASITYPMLKNFFHCALAAFPIRMKGFHIVNAPTYTNAMITLGKSLLKDKLKKRIHAHSKGIETLTEHIPKDILPPEYGGTYPHNMTVLRDLTLHLLKKHRDWFLQEAKIKADLSKKKESGKTLTAETNIFGLEGSFRKISID